MVTARGQNSVFHCAQLQGCSVLTRYAQLLVRAFSVARACARYNESWHTVTLKLVTCISKCVKDLSAETILSPSAPPEVWLLVGDQL